MSVESMKINKRPLNFRAPITIFLSLCLGLFHAHHIFLVLVSLKSRHRVFPVTNDTR